MKYYVRFEATNLSYFINDSSDLSTIRGGGLALLKAPELVRDLLTKLSPPVNTIIQSASIGLFSINTQLTAIQVAAQVHTHLANDELARHATFSVSVLPANSLDDVRHQLTAALRWQQMQAPTQVYPDLLNRRLSKAACQVDHIRPASLVDQTTGNSAKQFQSSASKLRRDYGRMQKQKLYSEEFGLPNSIKVAHDFSEIAGNSAQWGPLQNKVALLYLDGNKFGSRQAKLNETDLAQFSSNLRALQRSALRVLNTAATGNKHWINEEGTLRQEVLLWGGDEMILLLPAWLAWQFTRELFAELNRDPSLTWSAALIFCHEKAPIQRIKRLAYNLVEHIKSEVATDTEENLLHYQILESFDDLGYCPDHHYFERRYPFLAPKLLDQPFDNRLVLRLPQMDQITGLLPDLRSSLSRRKLIDFARQLMSGPATHAKVTQQPPSAAEEPDQKRLDELRTSLGEAVFYHLAELWDYVSPVRRRDLI